MPVHYATTQNSPLKLRTTSIPTTGKIFKVDDVNQSLLVELDGATVHEDTLSTSHYILDECKKIAPAVTQSVPGQRGSNGLKVMSLKLKDNFFYRDGRWKPMTIPHILRSTDAGSLLRCSSKRGHLVSGLRRETIHRPVSGTLGEIVEGTFIPAAGLQENHVVNWLNGITEALQVLIPKSILPAPTVSENATIRRILTHSTKPLTKPLHVWSSEASCKPVKGGPMSYKPDLVLWEEPS